MARCQSGQLGHSHKVLGFTYRWFESNPRYTEFEKYNNKCQICGWGEENPTTHKIPLQIHHIDGDCTNNKEENLQLLCPNCHSLTETFMSLNENSKRKYRIQKEHTANN